MLPLFGPQYLSYVIGKMVVAALFRLLLPWKTLLFLKLLRIPSNPH